MKIISQTYVHKHWHGVFYYVLTQWDNNIQKDDFNSFVPATINTFSCANPTRVAQSRIANQSVPSTLFAVWVFYSMTLAHRIRNFRINFGHSFKERPAPNHSYENEINLCVICTVMLRKIRKYPQLVKSPKSKQRAFVAVQTRFFRYLNRPYIVLLVTAVTRNFPLKGVLLCLEIDTDCKWPLERF